MTEESRKKFNRIVKERKKDHLSEFYKKVEEHIKKISPSGISCGNCYHCCDDSHFNMVLHKPEFELIEKYIEEMNLKIDVSFEPLRGNHIDKRLGFSHWVCPFYSFKNRGCRIYPVRPLVCRLYGPYAHEGDDIPECSYKKPIRFKTNKDIEIWDEYERVLKKYYNRRLGYVYRGSTLYDKPILEFLEGRIYPWSLIRDYFRY